MWRREALTCREVVEVINDYLEGALAPIERERVLEILILNVPGVKHERAFSTYVTGPATATCSPLTKQPS